MGMIFAQAAAMDPGTGSILSLIANMGTSGAVLLSVWIFVGFLRNKGEGDAKRDDDRDRRYEDIVARVTELMARQSDMMARQSEIIRENTQVIRDWHAAAAGISKGHEIRPPRNRGDA
jgi:hypothetical protein